MRENSRQLNRGTSRGGRLTGSHATLAALVAILLMGAILRWVYLPRMTQMLSYDESYYASDALSLLNHFQLTPFFQGNQGRESGWIYLLAGMMLGMGKTAFTAHLAATFLGILSIAAVYRLGRELLSTRIGVWSAFGMAVLYWPVHFSVIALRVNLLPFLGALSLALMLAAQRKNRTRLWIIAGITIAALTYSYIAARIWIAFEFLILSIWYLTNRRHRRGIVIAAAIAIVLSLPMVIYFIIHPEDAVLRISEAASISVGSFIGALQAWVNAWFVRGDYVLLNNSPNRPILDAPTALLFIMGLAGVWFTSSLRDKQRRQPRAIVLIAGIVVVSLLPSLLSEYPPSFLRSISLTIAIALILGVGAASIARVAARILRRFTWRWQKPLRLTWTLPMIVMLAAGASSYHDFGATWINDPGITTLFARNTHRAVMAVQQIVQTAVIKHVYITPYEMSNPIVQVSLPQLQGFEVGAFDPTKCLVVPRSPAAYVTTSANTRDLRTTLLWWGNVTTLSMPQNAPTRDTAYKILKLTPNTEVLDNLHLSDFNFADRLEVHTDLSSETTARGGDTLQMGMRVRALQPLDQPYSMFVHLYAVDAHGMIDDVRKWAQGDEQLCATYPTTLWQPDESIIQTYQLRLPADLPAGTYVIAIGIYQSGGGGTRLAVTHPQNTGPYSYVVLQHVKVEK